ncbi:collagen alpha-1(II) chain-like [Mustela putorius furo]|uniref:Collagen alpha-1(II) chain-like n=1 Tax=Mustela putorius furo TaxID=9669 RepID=A0A8U0S2X3_MUSPF|nr:collagen alpha-1(II) chain-like [Mustela putorius furo]
MTWVPYLVEPREGLAGREVWAGEPGGPLSAPCRRGMLRTPGRVPREAAPRNKCRVPWQRREFPGRGGRKRPPPSSRLRKQNAILLPGEQNGRKATPQAGEQGASGTPGIPSLSGATHCQSEGTNGS